MKKLAANILAGRISGAVVDIHVPSALSDEALISEVAQQIITPLNASVPVTLVLRGLGADRKGADRLEALCSKLNGAGVVPNPALGLSLEPPAMPLHVYTLLARRYFGVGPRYVVTQRSRESQLSDANWRYVFRHRATRWAVWPAYGATISSHCPLLSDEKARAVLPPFGLHGPANSAWLQIKLRLACFADKTGSICLKSLERALHECVDQGDRHLDNHVSDGQCDISKNRRLAIDVCGFGDIVKLQRRVPSDFAALRECVQLAQHVRDYAWSRSSQIAKRSPLLPAIAEACPVGQTAVREHDEAWSCRWKAAVERAQVRNRNLLVMSPYCVLPRGFSDCATYMDLLPVLACADAHSFADPPHFSGWNLLNFMKFHRRAKAVIESQSDTTIIAARV